ncbi:MAG: agmatine deiminase family protein [Acidobacteriota bacterium]
MNRRDFLWSSLVAGIAASRGVGAELTRPTVLDFTVPAEEAPHTRTWMCWPSRPEIYGRSTAYFESIQASLARLATAIAEHEPVRLLAAKKHHALAAELCGPKVELVDIPTDDMWARDSGPVFVHTKTGAVAVIDFNFNGWGGKQTQRENDEKVAKAIATGLGVPYERAGVVGEGGGLEYDGEGTLLLTDSCWVNDNRNPGLSQKEIEIELKRVLGIEKVIWLPGVKGRDITDGHIDGFLRVVRPGVLMTGGYPDDRSVWGRTLEEARKILGSTTDAKGRSFTIVDIPSATQPRSERMFTGYANYYVGNGAVYTPQFGDAKADAFAVAKLGELYPKRKIVTLEVDRIYQNGGGIHCVTQQEPAPRS